MAIKWKTPSGLLTIVREESEILDSVQVFLDQPYDKTFVKVISGQLPSGIVLEPIREGYSYGFKGTVKAVEKETEYGFTLRAYNERDFADRYFSIKVTNKLPRFDENQESLINCIETEYLSVQFNMIDNDSEDKIIKIAGTLPNGMMLNEFGLLYGVAENVDETTYYTFTLGIVREGVIVATKEFTVCIENIPEEAAPIWITESGNIGRIDFKEMSDLFVKAYDPNDYTGESLVYEVVGGRLPDDLHIESKTGRITGMLLVDDTDDYYFTVSVRNKYASVEREFYIQANVIKPEEDIMWVTPESLGSVNVGNQYYINIEAKANQNIEYTLSWGELPAGLRFTNGLISGEVKYQPYKKYSFIVEATNGYKTISRLFNLRVEKGLGLNAVDCYLYINHENDDEYNDLLASLDKSSAYEPSNVLYNIPNKPMIALCRMKCFDKVLLKDMLYYNRPLEIMWDKTYKKEHIIGGEVLYQAFYKGIKQYNSTDTIERYDYADGTSDSVSYPSINGIRELLSERINVEKLNKNNVLYDLGTQEIVDESGTKYPNYLIEYDEKTKTYYAKSQDEVKYLDVYAVEKEGDTPKQVFAAIEREDYKGNDLNELYGGSPSTEEWNDIIYGGNPFTEEWKEIIDSSYGRFILKPVKVFEEKLNTPVDYVNYMIYEKGTMNLQDGIMFTLAWKPDCKFIILNGVVRHIGSIDNPWLYNPELNDTVIHDKTIVLPYITDEDVSVYDNESYIHFFDIKNEAIDAWKTTGIPLWQPNTQYLVGDKFTYGDLYYEVKKNFISDGIFEDDYLEVMSEDEVAPYLEPYYYPTMNVLFAKPNTNLYLYQELNRKEKMGYFFTGRKMDFFEVHFSPIYNNNIDNFSIDFYNHNQTKSPEFQLI